MSLGQPDLYIGDQLMQTAKADPRPALAGLRISWGTDSRLELDPPSTLSGQLLIKGAMPSFLEVGAPVGLVDPVSGRCLFAGNLAPLKASTEESIAGAHRVGFTATSPLAELQQHKVVGIDWTHNESAAIRRDRLAGSMPRGWTLAGTPAGYTWIGQGRQFYLQDKSENWVVLAERYVRSYLQRFADTSYYVPGAGLNKRITINYERGKSFSSLRPSPGPQGQWTGTGAAYGSSGTAVLPTTAITRSIDWEKSPNDVITDLQVSSWGAYGAPDDLESWDFEIPMDRYFNNSAAQDAYGIRQAKIETAISGYNGTALTEWMVNYIIPYWLDTQSKWRPTTLQLPDSRVIATAALLNLLAVDTRPTAVVEVPNAGTAPGTIGSFVMAGEATWTGKKWITDLTLGRTL